MSKFKVYFIIVSIFIIAIVWVRLEKIRVAYVYQALRKQKKERIKKYYKLKLIYAEQISPAKIEAKAEKLGLVRPREKQFRYIRNMEK